MLIETPSPATVQGKSYKVYLGTYYHCSTPDKVIEELDKARRKWYRIKIYLGDQSEGLDWMEQHNTEGYIGRSTGIAQVPLLIYNIRTTGGPALLDHCIVKIKRTGRRGEVLYQHPKYHLPQLEIRPVSNTDLILKGYFFEVAPIGVPFKTSYAAKKYIDKLY